MSEGEDMTYNVVLLVEEGLTELDAAQVHSLHEGLDDHVVYHVLLPVIDAAARIEASLGAMSAGEMLAAPSLGLSPEELEEVRQESEAEAKSALTQSLSALTVSGAEAVGTITEETPVHALVEKIKEVDGREAIVLTRPHLVAEFFHVDWTSQARRKLGVPVLHLLERETFDQQAGEGEGVTGL